MLWRLIKTSSPFPKNGHGYSRLPSNMGRSHGPDFTGWTVSEEKPWENYCQQETTTKGTKV
jgi:hypothetical protein